ncbi:MAG: tetratricopeptide repeat protein, partial [Gudongella sp.]|nr:tetratricopeptide repeat protein [Gudongella sp.]
MSRRMRNYRVMAEEFYLEGKVSKALFMYRKAIRFSRSREDTSLLLFNVGVILTELGKIDGAIRCYEKIIDINPSYVDAYYQLGVICEDMGKNDEAMEFYRSALSI